MAIGFDFAPTSVAQPVSAHGPYYIINLNCSPNESVINLFTAVKARNFSNTTAHNINLSLSCKIRYFLRSNCARNYK